MLLWSIGWNGIAIKKAGFTGIAFFIRFHHNANQRSFVAKLVNKTSVRNLDKVLIVPLPHLDLLFPEDVFSYHNGSNTLLDAQINDATAGRVQITVDPAIALRRDPIQMVRGETVLMAQAALVRCALFIVKLVEAFEGLAADQAGDKPGLGEGRARPGR